jgi:hypothetical protein
MMPGTNVDLGRFVDCHACGELVTLFAHLLDHGRARDIADLFTADGELWAGETRVGGRDDIRRVMRRRDEMTRTSRHLCTNVLVEVLDEEHASGTSCLTAFVHDGLGDSGPAPVQAADSIEDVADIFIRTADGWRIAKRTVTRIFGEPRSPS